MQLLSALVIGALSGWIVGHLRRGQGYGLVGNLIVGMIGSLVGSFLFGLTHLTVSDWLGSLVMSVVGALVFLGILTALRPGRRSTTQKGEGE